MNIESIYSAVKAATMEAVDDDAINCGFMYADGSRYVRMGGNFRLVRDKHGRERSRLPALQWPADRQPIDPWKWVRNRARYLANNADFSLTRAEAIVVAVQEFNEWFSE